jgi:peptidoglycan hydrolase CwlO-like protein
MPMTEEDIERINKRGPNDLEETIDQLKKQVEFLQGKCRQAGKAILDQELTIKGLTKEIDRLSEENFNLSLVRGKDNGKK